MNALRRVIIYALIGEEIPHVEEIARMLAVEGSDDLAGVEVSETDDWISANPNSASTRADTDFTQRARRHSRAALA